MLSRSLLFLAGLVLLTAIGCHSAFYHEEKVPMKPNEMKFFTCVHENKQVIKVKVDSGGLPMDLLVVYKQVFEVAKEDFKDGGEPINGKLASVFREPNPTVTFKIGANEPFVVMLRNTSDRLKDVTVKITGQ